MSILSFGHKCIHLRVSADVSDCSSYNCFLSSIRPYAISDISSPINSEISSPGKLKKAKKKSWRQISWGKEEGRDELDDGNFSVTADEISTIRKELALRFPDHVYLR